MAAHPKTGSSGLTSSVRVLNCAVARTIDLPPFGFPDQSTGAACYPVRLAIMPRLNRKAGEAVANIANIATPEARFSM